MSEYTYIRITKDFAAYIRENGKRTETYEDTLKRLIKKKP